MSSIAFSDTDPQQLQYRVLELTLLSEVPRLSTCLSKITFVWSIIKTFSGFEINRIVLLVLLCVSSVERIFHQAHGHYRSPPQTRPVLSSFSSSCPVHPSALIYSHICWSHFCLFSPAPFHKTVILYFLYSTYSTYTHRGRPLQLPLKG